MSYARFSDADVYVFLSEMGLECCGCWLNPSSSWTYYSTQTMVDHLEEHIKAGHKVPATLIPELWLDDNFNFPYSGNDPE